MSARIVLWRRTAAFLVVLLIVGISSAAVAENADTGFIRGHTFIHPTLGFTVTLPDDFGLEYGGGKLLGATISGQEALRLDAVRFDAYKTLAQYLRSDWLEGVKVDKVETFSIHGITAATARAGNKDWQYRVFAIRFGTAVYRLIFAAHELTPELDQAFFASALSFRRLAPGEAEGFGK